MIRLIGVETRRFVSRRLFKVVTTLVFAAFCVAGTVAFIASENSSAAIAEWKAEKATAIDTCIRETKAQIDARMDDLPAAAETNPAAFCEENTWVEHPAFEYRYLDWMLLGFALPLMIVGWLFGASFVGAEWHNRTMTTLLTWEPRRLRVVAAKAIAAAFVVFAWVVSFQVIAAAAFYPAAHFEGSMVGVDAEWWWEIVQIMLRAGALGTVAATFGLALAMVGRNTAAALGVGFGYFAVVESLIRAFKPSWSDWLVGPNVELVLNGSRDASIGHTMTAGSLLLVAYVATALGLAAVVFKQRDIS